MFDAFSSQVQPAQFAGGEKHGLRSANPSRTTAAMRGSTGVPASPPAPDPFEPAPPFEPPPASGAPPVPPLGAPASIPPVPLAPPDPPAMPATSPVPPTPGPAPPAPPPEDLGEHAAGSQPIAHSETMMSTAARREVPTISTAAKAVFWSIIPASTDISRAIQPVARSEECPRGRHLPRVDFLLGGLDGGRNETYAPRSPEWRRPGGDASACHWRKMAGQLEETE